MDTQACAREWCNVSDDKPNLRVMSYNILSEGVFTIMKQMSASIVGRAMATARLYSAIATSTPTACSIRPMPCSTTAGKLVFVSTLSTASVRMEQPVPNDTAGDRAAPARRSMPARSRHEAPGCDARNPEHPRVRGILLCADWVETRLCRALLVCETCCCHIRYCTCNMTLQIFPKCTALMYQGIALFSR